MFAKGTSKDPSSKKSLPIDWRLSLHVAGMGFLLCFSVLLSLLPFQYSRVEQDSITEARILAEAVSAIYQRLGPKEPKDHARKLLLRVARTPHISLVNVYDNLGIVRYSTDSRELGKQYNLRLGVVREDNLMTVNYVSSDATTGIGGVSVFIDRDLMLLGTHRLFIQVGLGLLIVVGILAFLVKGLSERLVSSRLSRLLDFIEDAEKGSFLIRSEIDRHDEIGHVIAGFNQLLGVITQIEAKELEKEHNFKDAEVQKNIRLKLEDTLSKLERSNEMLNSKVQAQELLMDAAHRLGATLKKEAVVEELSSLLKERMRWPIGAIFLLENKNQEKQILRLVARFGMEDEVLPLNSQVVMGEGIVGVVAQTGAPLVIANLEKEKNLKLWESFSRSNPQKLGLNGSLLAVPMIHKSRVFGAFIFIHPQKNIFEKEQMELVAALGAQTALALVNAELYETTLELATYDPLTGIMNRRAMVRQISNELTRAQRFKTELALLLVDVDHFKNYNDRMGHVLGDVALKEIAMTLQSNVRKVDTVARFGGEEFCVILPQTDRKAACEVANKLCEAIREVNVRGASSQELGHMSVSIGIAIVPVDSAFIEQKDASTEIVAAADRALYEAKALGRDRFVVNDDFPLD